MASWRPLQARRMNEIHLLFFFIHFCISLTVEELHVSCVKKRESVEFLILCFSSMLKQVSVECIQ